MARGPILNSKDLRMAGKVIRHPRRALLRLVLRTRLRRIRIAEERKRLLGFLS
jgi:hypothetical protein